MNSVKSQGGWFNDKHSNLDMTLQKTETHTSEASKKSFQDSWKEFTQETSHHGIKYTGDSNVSIPRRFFWGLAVLASWCFIVYLVITSIYRAFGTEVSTEFKLTTVNPMPFPAVTICNYNQYRKSYFHSADLYSKAVLSAMFPDYLGRTDIYVRNKTTTNPAFNATALFIAAAHQIHDMTLKCFWNSVVENCTDIFTTLFTDQGVCYTFNADKSRVQVSPGSGSALQLMMVLESQEYFASENLGTAGLKVLVHDHDQVPLMKQFGFVISPGVDTSVSLSKRKAENHPITGCLDTKTEANFLEFYDVYTMDGCQQECITKCVNTTCNCKLFYQPGNFTVCNSPTSITCAKAETVSCGTSKEYNCGELCRPTCDSVIYRRQLSFGKFPDESTVDFLIKALASSMDYLEKNAIKITVFMEDLSVTNIIQSKAYTNRDMFSDVGGQMGLCLGASLMTLCEFLDFLLLQLIHRCQRRHDKRKLKSTQ